MAVPSVTVAVVMQREQGANQWEAWRFRVIEVVPQEAAFGNQPRLLRDDGSFATWLYPGFEVSLHADEAEGYYLNLSTPAPVWFVMWRIDDEDASRAWPERVMLSYNEAGRLLDAQERVDNVALQEPWRVWLQAYADEHYKPEPKRRQRPQSFKAPQDRQ